MPETTGSLLDRAFRTMLREELEPIKSRLDGVESEPAGLKESLVGLIDERFHLVDQKPREGGPSSLPVAVSPNR